MNFTSQQFLAEANHHANELAEMLEDAAGMALLREQAKGYLMPDELYKWLSARNLIPDLAEDGSFALEDLITALNEHENALSVEQAKGAQGEAISLDARYKVLTEFLRFVNLLIESAKQSKSNPNACFLDWRDVCALRGDMPYVRESLDALAAPRAAVPDLSNWQRHYSINDAAMDALRSMLYATPCAAVPDGWKLVPIKATGEMQSVGRSAYLAAPHMSCFGSVWQAMLSAAPTEDKDHD